MNHMGMAAPSLFLANLLSPSSANLHPFTLTYFFSSLPEPDFTFELRLVSFIIFVLVAMFLEEINLF